MGTRWGLDTMSWKSTEHTGVRYRSHQTRKHGAIPDKYFSIRYQADGKRKEEGLGWATDGWTASKAALKLTELKIAAKIGKGHTRLSAQRRARAEEDAAEQAAQAVESKRKVTYKQYWEQKYSPGDIKPSSLKRENGLNRMWIIPAIGSVEIPDVSYSHIRKVQHQMTKSGQSPRSVQYALGVIRKVINHAIGNHYYQEVNPVSALKKQNRPKVSNKRERFLTHTEADKLLNALLKRSKPVRDMTLLSIRTGMRAGEIFSLDWQNVDIARRTISLTNTKSNQNRIIIMSKLVLAMFKTLQKGSGQELVFPSRRGEKRTMMSKTFALTVEDLKLNVGVTDRLQKVVFHTCRHTCASWMAQAGVSLYQIKEIMGHSTVAVTERYSHLCPMGQEAAFAAMEAQG